MRGNEKTIFGVQIVALVILLVNSFFISFFNNYIEIGYLIFLLVALRMTCGLASGRLHNSKSNTKLTLFYSVAFLIFKYSFALIINSFYRTPYALSFMGIIKNVVPLVIIILMEEAARYSINVKSNGNKIILFFNIILFTFVDFSLYASFADVSGIEATLKLLTTTFVQSLFMNIGLTIISYKHGNISAIIYNMIFTLYVYLIPIVPGFGPYVETIVMMIIPLVVTILLHYGLPDFRKKKNKVDIRERHLGSKVLSVFLTILVLVIVGLNSNLFRYWVCVVGSGSMTPTILIGDLIIVDKSYKNRVKELEKGDILVFSIEGKTYTHRIIEVHENNGEKTFVTQGDRKGQAIDDWVVTKNEIVGVTVARIPYAGQPSIWLRNLFEESKK